MASQNPTRVVKHIVVFGESGVGKTCFADMFTHGEHYVNYDPTLEDRMCRKLLDVNGVTYALDLMDLNASHYREGDPALSAFIFEHWLQEADGVVLLYDITSPSSFDLITDEGYINVFLNRKATRDDGKQWMGPK
ncbi:hypothetical protein P154DRAFT_619211 [Amniculicola lignicola CBS 123094]|uniref:P-loop containing nucleoside triphosphate hydrolase protein n=1 Tax=Amniculicola lignicola CBS 123094 TaxID=1392246 RepID=A0A6A5WIL6_9PLEO|nr:hypothetical protein P154DRAFT_619211 [Amniculicola lignicola CBS 123094]